MAGFDSIKRVEGIKRGSLSTQMKIQQALDELKKRGVTSDYCPRCGTADWNVDLLSIPATSALSSRSTEGLGQVFPRVMPYSQSTGVIPLLGIVCKNCGYSMFHNLNVLGIVAE